MENKHTRSVSLIDGHIEDITDAEIVKALKCCTNSFYNGFAKCEECPKFTEMSGCTIKLMCNALDLIKRQQAEIERLKAESNMADGYEDALVEMTKSEAIKEFAERLCEDRVSNDPVVIAVKTELKMTEVKENG